MEPLQGEQLNQFFQPPIESEPTVDTSPVEEALSELEDLKASLIEQTLKLPKKKRDEMLRKVMGDRYPGNSYYNRRYALQIVEDIKYMIESGDVLIYPHSNYPTWSLKTIYMYVNNGFRYLVDHLDDAQKTFQKARSKVSISIDTKKDLVRVILKEDRQAYQLRAIRVKPDDALAIDSRIEEQPIAEPIQELGWRQDMYEWMEKTTEKGQIWPEESKRFAITDEDVAYLEGLFETDECFGIMVNKKERTFFIRRLV